jgi:hypothetical protein
MVTYWRIAITINMTSKAGEFSIFVCLPVALAAAGAIQSNSSCPMTVSRDF